MEGVSRLVRVTSWIVSFCLEKPIYEVTITNTNQYHSCLELDPTFEVKS